MARKKRIHEEQEKKAKAYKQKIGKPLKKRQGPPAPKKKVSPAKLKRKAAIGSLKGRAASAIGGAGHPVSRAAGKRLKKTQRKKKVRKYVAGVKERVREYHAERGQKRAEKALAKGKGLVTGKKKVRKPSYKSKKSKNVSFSLKKGTKVRKGAVGVQKTKGGEYVKYGKKSEAAGSFRKAFKAGCAGGAKSFSWDGRSYSCKKK